MNPTVPPQTASSDIFEIVAVTDGNFSTNEYLEELPNDLVQNLTATLHLIYQTLDGNDDQTIENRDRIRTEKRLRHRMDNQHEANRSGVLMVLQTKIAELKTQRDRDEITEHVRSKIDTIIGDLQKLERIYSKPPRITLVGDRESNNMNEILGYSENTNRIQLGGLIVPAYDIDEEVINTFTSKWRMTATDKEATDKATGHFDEETGDFFVDGPFIDFGYLHAPYDAKKIKENPDVERRRYCEEILLPRLQATDPDLIFLSNFKIILDRIVAEKFAGKIINVHPSKLPLLKGWRTEDRAINQGENSEYNGYTFHNVDTTLDGGATYFQQKVHVPLYDPQMTALKVQLGNDKLLTEEQKKEIEKKIKAYETAREEEMRLRIIIAQSRYTPYILDFVSSKIKRKIIEDSEAFAVEGRPGFENSDAYLGQLQEEFREWCEHHKDQQVDYETWHTQHRRPYQRVLFDFEGQYQTLEAILKAAEFAEEKDDVEIITTYEFLLPYDMTLPDQERNHDAYQKIYPVIEKARYQRIQASNDGLYCHIECTTTSLASILSDINAADVKIETRSVRTTAKRKPRII